MMNHYKRVLFPIHLFTVNIRENVIIQKEILSSIQEICQDKELEIPDGWLTDKLFTSFNADEINQSLFSLDNNFHKIYREYVGRMFDKPVNLSLDDIWFNYYINGEFQEEHTHISSTNKKVHYSCIHYLKFDPTVHLPTTFSDPLENLRPHSMEMDCCNYSSKWRPKIEEGDLIMFPSYLPHFVPKSQPTPGNPRVTISFNLTVESYGDENED